MRITLLIESFFFFNDFPSYDQNTAVLHHVMISSFHLFLLPSNVIKYQHNTNTQPLTKNHNHQINCDKFISHFLKSPNLDFYRIARFGFCLLLLTMIFTTHKTGL